MEEAEAIISEGVGEFMQWVATRDAVPTIRELRDQAERTAHEQDLPEVTEELVRSAGSMAPAPVADAYAIVPDPQHLPTIMALLQSLRGAGLAVQMHASGAEGMGSMKSQFKKADASGARYALIFGADELARHEVTWKSLRDGQGQQETTPLNTLASFVAKRLAEGARLQSA